MYLEQLAARLLKRRRHAFQVTAPPPCLPRSVNSPVPPFAKVASRRFSARILVLIVVATSRSSDWPSNS